MSDIDRVAIVTGGANGIGRSIVDQLYNNGYHVSVIDRDIHLEDKLDSFDPDRLILYPGDLGDPLVLERFVARTIERFGKLTALVNNGAIASPNFSGDLQDWDSIMAVNLRAPFYLSRICRPELSRSRGSIVNIASTRAMMSEPHTEAYSSSKGGLITLTHSLAITYGPDVRVNAISPGWIHTGSKNDLSEQDHTWHPAGRVGEPLDIAEMVLYLLSEKSSFITGQNFVIDGGMTRRMIYP